MGALFTIVLLACVAAYVLWSVMVRKFVKTRFASICSIFCVIGAFIVTVIAKDYVTDPAFFERTLLPLAEPWIPAELMEMFHFSTTLNQTIIGLPVALIAPLVFVVLYLVLKLLTGIVYAFVVFFAGRRMKKVSKKVPYAKERAFAWSAAAGLLTLVVVLIPVAFYGGMAADAIAFISNIDVLDKETEATLDTVSEEYITPITDSVLIQAFRAMGGDTMLGELTTFKLNGEVISVNEELENILDVANGVAPLLGSDFQDLSKSDAQKIVNAVDSLTESKFLTSIAAEAVYFFTDDIVNGDEPLSLDETGMFDTLVDRVVHTLHDDAKAVVRPQEGVTSADVTKNRSRFKADLKTVAELAANLLESGALANTGDTDALLDELATGDTIKNMISTLGKNEGLKCLIPEVVNIGIKAIASFMELEDSVDVVYAELMETIAADLNSVKDLDDAAKVETLSPKLNNAFDHAGIVIDKQVLDLYSVAMIYELVNGNDNEITPADVTAFFVAYAEGAENENATGAPAALAQMILELSALEDAKAENFQTDVETILAAYGQKMLGTTEGALYEKVVGVKLKRILDSNVTEYTSYTTAANAASLQSVEEMKKTTFLRTRDMLLIDIDEAAKLITAETRENEAETIANIFGYAGDLMDDVSGEISISTMAGSVGNILNAFNGSVCVGEERTSNLFIAILQSSLVRDAANMDIFTATDLAYRGSTGENVDYAKTFKTLSNTMDVLQNMNSSSEEGMSVDALTTVLKDLNAQSAGMMESYITEERLSEDYGLDADQSETAAPLISDVFGYWNEPGVAENMTEEESKKEAEALNDVMNLVTSASDKANSGESSQTVFGGEDSVLGKSADETVETFMASEALKHSLNKNSENGTLEDDPFGMGDMMVDDEENSETQDLKNAMSDYYAKSEDKENDKEALTNLGKLFGFSTEDMDEILGE